MIIIYIYDKILKKDFFIIMTSHSLNSIIKSIFEEKPLNSFPGSVTFDCEEKGKLSRRSISLPPELIRLIFSYLDESFLNVSLTCKSFFVIMFTPQAVAFPVNRNSEQHLTSQKMSATFSKQFRKELPFNPNIKQLLMAKKVSASISKLLLLDERITTLSINTYCMICFNHNHGGALEVVLKDKRLTIADYFVSCFETACKKGHHHSVRLSLKYLYDAISQKKNIFDLTYSLPHIEVIQTLLADPRIGPPDKYQIVFREACKLNHVEVAKALLNQADPTANNSEVLTLAVQNNHWQLLEILMKDKRLDPSMNNNILFLMACEADHVKIIETLLKDPRVKPPTEHERVIYALINFGHTEILKILIKTKRINLTANNYSYIKKRLENMGKIINTHLETNDFSKDDIS